MKKILVINAGSSSIKLSLFEKDNLKNLASGLAERITLNDGIITIKYNGEKHVKNVDMKNHTEAVKYILDLMSEIKLIENPKDIEIIGFRVVHGGTHFAKTTELNENAIALIDKCKIYAPLHNPGALQAISAFKEVMPHAKMAAEFDTSFHTTIPDVNAIYPIPLDWTNELGIRKYGAHGISHEYISMRLGEILKKDKVTFVNMHVGNGASLCAVKDSKSFDTTMGLTPLAGVMMGTRSGDIDPSIPNFVASTLNMSIAEVTSKLNNNSGLLGVSTISSDMRDITSSIANGDKQAEFALDLYCQKIADYVANYANKLEKIDALVFTAGIGENSSIVREKVIEKLHFANIKLDKSVNNKTAGKEALITTEKSDIPVYVIPTNEELLIAKHSLELFK